MKWKWFHDITTSSLYEIKSDTTIHKYDALDHLQRRNRHYFTPFGEPTPAIPLTAAPVIPHTANHALCCTTGYPLYQPLAPPTHTTFISILET